MAKQRRLEGNTENASELKEATERAERAEAELARLKAGAADDTYARGATKSHPERSEPEVTDGIAELRKDSMMVHLMDSLAAGKDIGHYGRLVFAMVARHFLSEEEVLDWLTRDPDFSAEQAGLMLRQVENRDYNPPKRDRILAWQAEQDFPIMPHPEDPDCGNLYRNLKFPDSIYHHIEEYREQKTHAESGS